ncbi:MAG: VWA domain-containing protein, partial [Erysipelotrichaceae bacterium]|nr:VWA domain-containing protein [Erysipelotrichaceae bacterium]
CAHALLVLDCSGSMNSHRNQTIQSVNSFLQVQKESDVETKITNIFFNDTVDKHESKRVQNMPELSADNYRCHGSTALFDAIGHTITSHQPESDELTMVVIMTDGMENASREYSLTTVKKLIEEKTKQGWLFTFLGADLSSSRDADDLGIRKEDQKFFKKNDMKKVVDDVSRSFNSSKLTPRFLTADELCLLDEGHRKVIVDTGSPISFSDESTLRFLNDRYVRSNHALLPMIQKYLSSQIGGLIGMDILSQYDLSFRYDRGLDRWIVKPWQADTSAGYPFRVEYYGGVPVVEAIVDGKRGRFFLDTGATISFLRKRRIEQQPYLGEAEDFFPTLGIFSTDLYRCRLEFASQKFSDSMGVMPDGLEMLMPDWVDGIIGLNVLRDFNINFGFKSQVFSIS